MSLSIGNTSNANKRKRLSTNLVGKNWNTLTSAGTAYWTGASFVETNNNVIYACDFMGSLKKTTDAGQNWSVVSSNTFPIAIATSSNGSVVHFAAKLQTLYTSTNSGSSFTSGFSSSFKSFNSIDCSDDGQYAYAAAYYNINPGGIYVSSNSGAGWSSVTNSGTGSWYDISCSGNGSIAIATRSNGNIQKTVNFGSSWADITSPGQTGSTNTIYNVKKTAMSKDGNIFYVADNNYLYKSTDGGTSWGTITPNESNNIRSITCSSSGKNVAYIKVLTSTTLELKVSNDFGVSWYTVPSSSFNFSPSATQILTNQLLFSKDATKIILCTNSLFSGAGASGYLYISNYV